MKKITTGIVYLLATLCMSAQEKQPVRPDGFGKLIQTNEHCGASVYEEYLEKINSNNNFENFQRWLAPKIYVTKARLLHKNTNDEVTFPVVVHVVHDGDPIGNSENITDAQILSQLTVLNQDFGRFENTPGYNENPVGTDTGIRFCLAQTDPQGNPTTGIERINMGQASWGLEALELTLKPQVHWDPAKYINIYVVRFGGNMQGVGGYAFPPFDSATVGLEDFENLLPIENDGLVVDYRVFGSEDLYPDGTYLSGYKKGRTATHEMGHYFGLRHIWGDGDCAATDYCDDTPAAAGPNSSCNPTDSCPELIGEDMIENYMDYTPDSCQNIFTLDQKIRMLTVIENSALRSIQAGSMACNPSELGIDDHQNAQIVIYPNPVEQYLSINLFNDQGYYFLYNSLGQLIGKDNLQQPESRIDLEQLTPGVYYLEVRAENRNAFFKIIKK